VIKVITVYEPDPEKWIDHKVREIAMTSEDRSENLVEKEVTYTLYKDGQFFIVEKVPARVDLESGEQYFSPKTVESLQKIILEKRKPVRTIETPVYTFV